MTTELQRAMARYEGARIAYQKAVLASLNGDSTGAEIRVAIRDVQRATAELRRVRGVPARPMRQVVQERPQRAPLFGFGAVRRLLSAG